MKKISLFLLCALALVGCSKHDPILPGTRHDIFDGGEVKVENLEIEQLSESEKNIYGDDDCDYSQDSSNSILHGNTKIFSGVSVDSFVKNNQKPICVGNFVYTGFSTGEVVKINKNTKKLVWNTDVFKETSLVGGTSVIDIVARVGFDKNYLYVGGLGDAFCKLNANSGSKVWCLDISVPVDFIMVDEFVFVVGGDNNLYAINAQNGKVYWKTHVRKQVKPHYENEIIKVGRDKIYYKNGALR